MHRIQKIMSMLGLVSRRDAEKLINSKRIYVNGKIAEIGQQLYIGDILKFNQKEYLINNALFSKEVELIAYHKKCGEIVTKKTSKTKNTVFDKLPFSSTKWINIGRLDVSSSGLILFTNSGDLANKLMHPSSMIKRSYHVMIDGVMNKKDIAESISGVDIGRNETGQFIDIKYKKKESTYKVILATGKNREIRRTFKTLGYQVRKLHRVQYGDVVLGDLAPGKTRIITKKKSKLFLY